MNKISIPPWLNLKQKEIFDIVNRFYIERINVIRLIEVINRIALIDTISSVTIANVKTNSTDIVNVAVKLLMSPIRITNGGFEDNFTGWTTTNTPTISSTVYHSGSKSCLMEYNQSIKQYPNVAINNIVSFKIWVKKAAGAGNTYFTFTSTAGSMNYLLPGAVGGYDWVEVDLLAAMIAAGASGTLTAIGFLRMDDFHVDYWIDDIVLLDNAIDFASETTLAALNATLAALYTKIPLDPAKESGKLTTIDATLTAIKATDGIKKIIDAVNVGTVTTLPAVTLADAENRVLPKAQGKTTITQSNTAINATVTIYTVTAGKTFYLCGVILEGMLYAPSLNDNVYFLIDGNIVINLGISTSILIDRAQAVAPFSLSVPLPFPAGTVFAVRSGIANLLASASMIGWEE